MIQYDISLILIKRGFIILNIKNRLKRIELLVFDFEGCLSPGKGKPHPLVAWLRILEYCTSALYGRKPPLVLCTGRSQPYVECVLQAFNAFFPGIPSIVENGLFLYLPVENELLPHPAIKDEISTIQKLNLELIETLLPYGPAEPGKEVCVSITPDSNIEIAFKKIIGDPIFKRFLPYYEITHSNSAVDFVPKDRNGMAVDKRRGLEFLSEYTGIPISNMLGSGDSRGDLPMLEVVGFPTCPSNASKDVKKIVAERGGYIAGLNDAFGAVEIMQMF
jgi:hydroxymethylpyrimidine pyrophosphatase-like HAD family hydrolase